LKVKDRILIPIVLALYIGLWILTGTAMRVAIAMWKRLNMAVSMFTTPLGIFLLLSATGIGIIYCVRRAKQ